MALKRMRCERQFECLENRCYLSSVGWDGPGRGSADLNYYIGKAPSYLGQPTVEAAFERALSAWSDVVDITFTQTPTVGRRDSIDFTFGRIDGSGGTLAQAYLPDDVNSARIAGDIQFDTSETWEVGNGQGNRAFDLVLVAVHEIGHALGLEHSRRAGSVMGSTVSPSQAFTKLAAADVDAALSLYAAADKPGTTVNTTPTTPTSSGGTTTQQPTGPGGTGSNLPRGPMGLPWLRPFGPQRRLPRSWDFSQFTSQWANTIIFANTNLEGMTWSILTELSRWTPQKTTSFRIWA